MAEQFYLVEVSVRKGAVRTTGAGLWRVSDDACRQECLRVARAVSYAVRQWHETHIPAGDMAPHFGYRARIVRIPPEKLEWARQQVEYFREDSPERFVSPMILNLYGDTGGANG